MFHNRIKALFNSAVSSVASGISGFTFHPEKDLTRTKKLPAATLLRFLVSQGASSTRTELMDFFGMDTQAPSASALNQQRAKLKATAPEAVFRRFSTSVDPCLKHHWSVRLPFIQTGIRPAGNMGEADRLQHNRNPGQPRGC